MEQMWRLRVRFTLPRAPSVFHLRPFRFLCHEYRRSTRHCVWSFSTRQAGEGDSPSQPGRTARNHLFVQSSQSPCWLRRREFADLDRQGPTGPDGLIAIRAAPFAGAATPGSQRCAWGWGPRLTTSTRRFSGALGSILFFGRDLP